MGRDNSCIKKLDEVVKHKVAYDRLQGLSMAASAKKHGITATTICRWEKDDEGYLAIIAEHTTNLRRAITGKLFKDMEDVAKNVMKVAKKDAELGFKVLKELGAFKTAGNDVGMTQAEVQAAGGVTIVVMGEVSKEGTPVIDVDAVVEGDVDVNG